MNNEIREPNLIQDKRRNAIKKSARKVSQGLEIKKCLTCPAYKELTNCIYCGKVICIKCIEDNACLICHRSRYIVKLKEKKWYNFLCCF